MATAGDVVTSVAALMDDQVGDEYDFTYLQPFIQQCNYRLFQNIFGNPNVPGAKLVALLVNIPAGTTSLNDYMQTGQPLSLLSQIFDIREKPTGTGQSAYRPMQLAMDIPIMPDTPQDFNGIYVLGEDNILLPGASQALDIRVWGEFKPTPITASDTLLLPDTDVILVHWVCELASVIRGTTPEFTAYHRAEKQAAIDELFNNIIMKLQEIPFQQRSYNRGSSGWNYLYNQ